MVKLRKVSRGLGEIFNEEPQSNESSIGNITFPNVEAEFYAAIRSKGGSGEKHLVKQLATELIASNKKVIICYENPILDNDIHLTHFFPEDLTNLLTMKKLDGSGVLNLNWRDEIQLKKLFLALEGIDDLALILTVGTDSAAALYKRVERALGICKKVFISVDSSCDNSIEPAKNICSLYKESHKIYACCWYATINSSSGKSEYKLKSFKANQFTDYSNDKLSQLGSNGGEEKLLLM
jgi:hypothetical protein